MKNKISVCLALIIVFGLILLFVGLPDQAFQAFLASFIIQALSE